MREFFDSLLRIRKSSKGAIVLLVDLLICPISVWLAFYFRLGEWAGFEQGFQIATLASLLISLPCYVAFGFYRIVLRHATMSMLQDILRASLLYGCIYGSIFTLVGVAGVPRTIGLIQPILLFLGIACSRAVFSYWFGIFYRGQAAQEQSSNVLIYGAGSSGRQLADALDTDGGFQLIGYVDDARELQGRKLDRVPIFSPDDLDRVIAGQSIDEVFLAMPSARRSQRKRLMKMLHEKNVHVRTLPSMIDLARGEVQISDLRPLAIEDLLGREVIAPDPILLASDIRDKTVMVTGAGGSIGSELARQALNLKPHRLLLVDSSEYALYAIHQELERLQDSDRLKLVPLLATVRDPERLEEIFTAWQIDTVYHAAAYKHVPLVEHNPFEGVQNNVFGTLEVVNAARRNEVKKFVLISTDKAVRPTNVMGASKRAAELILQAMAAGTLEEGQSGTRFTMVRFGNVLGSSGSVVPLFREQIESGGPITVTHKDINRYFMTIPEAAQLVIQAGALAEGGEVFVLDMGEPVRIADLATKMVELSGLTIMDEAHPDGDIEIREVGLRPGEKLYEELLIGDNPEQTTHPRIMKANEQFIALEDLVKHLDAINDAYTRKDARSLKEVLAAIVPGYQPNKAVTDWAELERADQGNHKRW